MLCAIRNYFKAGTISKIRKDTDVITLEICTIDAILDIIIPFFEKYPLKGTKYFDFINWRKGFNDFLINRKTLDNKLGLIVRLQDIKSKLNANNTDLNLTLENLKDFDGNYISGLATGDGSFTLVTKAINTNRGFGQTTFSIFKKKTNLKLL